MYMRKRCILLLLAFALLLTACSGKQPTPSADAEAVHTLSETTQVIPREAATETPQALPTETPVPLEAAPESKELLPESPEEEERTMTLTIGDTQVPVLWEDNDAVQALKALAAGNGLVIRMSMYGGFEQVGDIGTDLPRDDAHTTTSAGDIVLYSGDQLVIFYGSNSWAYTRLGHIDLSPDEMAELLGRGDVTVTIIA